MRSNQAQGSVPKGSIAGSTAPRPTAVGALRNGKAAATTTRPSPSLKPGLY